MSQVLMPKATAVWLVENSTLTFDQVSGAGGAQPDPFLFWPFPGLARFPPCAGLHLWGAFRVGGGGSGLYIRAQEKNPCHKC